MSPASPSSISPSLVAAGGLLGGFAAARYTKRRELGGVVFVLAGTASGREWLRRAGPGAAAALAAVYAAAMGGSHPLAKHVGAWPAVLLVTGVTALTSEAVLRSGGRRSGRSR
jgi:hypothetical protein